MTTNFKLAYSLVVVLLLDTQSTFCSYVDDVLDMNGFIFLDPHDYNVNSEHNTQPIVLLKLLQWGINMST
jgi:hypothetical protein